MSPEQIEQSPDLDHRSDIYSLGAVLYEILAGRSMFEGKTVKDVLDQVTHVVPPPPSEIAPDRDVPEHLEDICMRCIRKDPGARIQTARKLVAELRNWRLRWAAAASS
jgi:serine/threonine protein kinase